MEILKCNRVNGPAGDCELLSLRASPGQGKAKKLNETPFKN